MIIGTARSQKHLHVSADKLCRWLRSKYFLRPQADGLLGRQELKKKSRRLQKRMRLMSAVGAKSTTDVEVDEGIRMDWVCVNVGSVEGGVLEKTEAEKEAEKKIVGFNTRTHGSHIAVQLMTETRRFELNLEKLWTDNLNRSKKAKKALFAKEGDDPKPSTSDMSEVDPSTSESTRTQYSPIFTSGTSGP
jgi:ribosomal silencing factor RsfS